MRSFNVEPKDCDYPIYLRKIALQLSSNMAWLSHAIKSLSAPTKAMQRYLKGRLVEVTDVSS
jgi:hypothetical protein